jgi:kynurenine formamidase
MKKYIDLSITLKDNMKVYPGDNPFVLKTRKTLEKDGYTDQSISASMHVGTHMDAPSHMLDSSEMISDYELSNLIGKGVIISVSDKEEIKLTNQIKTLDLKDKMVLFDTNHKPLDYKKYPLLSEALIDYLITEKIKCILLDTPSPDDAPFTIHKKLLSNHIPIIENVVNIQSLKEFKDFTIYAIPLKINASGAYTRVFAEINI